MAFKVGLPCILDCRFEGDDQNPLCAKLFGQLVGGKRLAKAHFRVPEESRNRVHVFGPTGMKIGMRDVNRFCLFPTHVECLMMRSAEFLS